MSCLKHQIRVASNCSPHSKEMKYDTRVSMRAVVSPKHNMSLLLQSVQRYTSKRNRQLYRFNSTPTIKSELSRVLDIFLYCSGVRAIVRFARRLEFLPFDSGILASYYFCFYTFLNFMYIRFSLYSNSFYRCHA